MSIRFVVATVLALGALVFGAAEATTQAGVARFREQVIRHHEGGDHAGAVDTWRTAIWLLHKEKIVGTGALVCVRVDTNTSIHECSGTYILPRGRVQVAGEIINRASFQLTITGGSGIYAAVGGVAIFSGHPNLGSITFFLV